MDTIIYDPQTKRQLSFPLEKVLTIGRSTECDIVIPDREAISLENEGLAHYISGHHALLRFDGLSLIVFDISKNGTYVRNAEINEGQWMRLRNKSWTPRLTNGYEVGFGRGSEERKYVLQVTDEERVRRSLERNASRRFVEILRQEKRANL